MKGVLICGGLGTRLRPLTEITNKSLLPVYDKPLLLYPLQVLLDTGIRDIAVITGPEHMDQMTNFLGSGLRFGCTFTFQVQEKPDGIAQALGLAESFADGDSVCAILGDNVFFDDIAPVIKGFTSGAHLFLKEVHDPERFGVAEIAELPSSLPRRQAGKLPASPAGGQVPCLAGRQVRSISVLSLKEKPPTPKSNLAVTGCYLYEGGCFEIIKKLKPSARGELEITDLSAAYIPKGQLTATILQDEWIDAGTFESLFHAAKLVRRRKLPE